MWCRLGLVITDVWEDHTASIFRMKRVREIASLQDISGAKPQMMEISQRTAFPKIEYTFFRGILLDMKICV
jgi:hypothetical protein